MVTEMQHDPFVERRKYPEAPKGAGSGKDLLSRYRESVDETVAFRTIVLIVVVLAMHLCFNFIDRAMYPLYASFFLQLRLVIVLPSILISLPAFFKRTRKYSIWAVDTVVLLHVAGLCTMIYSSDGASSPYFAGINLVLMGMSLLNGFYFWHTLGVCLLSLGLYLAACFYNYAGFSIPYLLVGSTLMAGTGVFASVFTRFYNREHFNSFLRNEELKESERRLKILFGMADEKSKTDDLTMIYNRRYFFEILADKITNSRLTKNFFYLIIFDIDHFKDVNDTYGHIFGDQVISTIAKTVRDMMRLNSYIGRYGGDEFMLIIDRATTEELLRRVGMISQAIRELEFTPKGKPVHVSASFGISRYDPDKGMNETRLIELADMALLEVKRSGRGEILLAQ